MRTYRSRVEVAERRAGAERPVRRRVAAVVRVPVPERQVVVADVAALLVVRQREGLAVLLVLQPVDAAALQESETIRAVSGILVVAAGQATTARVSEIPVTAAGIPTAD